MNPWLHSTIMPAGPVDIIIKLFDIPTQCFVIKLTLFEHMLIILFKEHLVT